MRIFISNQTGSAYWVEFDGQLFMTTPLSNSDDYMLNLVEDGHEVDIDTVENEKLPNGEKMGDYLRRIQEELTN